MGSKPLWGTELVQRRQECLCSKYQASPGASVPVNRELEILKYRRCYFLLIFKFLEDYCGLYVSHKWTGFSVSFNSLGFQIMVISFTERGKKVCIWHSVKSLPNFVEKLWLALSFALESAV